MMRAALHVVDALPTELFLEPRHAPPGSVLPALIGQDLPWRPIVGDTPGQGFHHKLAALVVGHDEAHEVARVVVQERGYVDPLVLAQQEREQIRLPELVGLGSLEALRLGLGLRLRPGLLLRQAFGFEHPPDRRLGGPDA